MKYGTNEKETKKVHRSVGIWRYAIYAADLHFDCTAFEKDRKALSSMALS